MKRNLKKNGAITLIALVITIIVLIILAGVSINLVVGDNGIITKAKDAKEKTEIASLKTEISLEILEKQMESSETGIGITNEDIRSILSKYGEVTYEDDEVTVKGVIPEGKNYEILLSEIWNSSIESDYNKEKKVNAPKLLTGMTPIKFEYPTDDAMGKIVETTKNDNDWYEYGETYETRRWANAQTEDGSMWVWIPRFAYKISGTTIDVKFLIGTTDNYYADDGTIKTAQRQTIVDETIDTTSDYTVHPAFTDESSINYANGGWDKELTGIWVAKFEAGYASGNNNAEVKASNVNYSQSSVWGKAVEVGTTSDGWQSARNWLDGIYEETTTSIKYPTFQGTTYAMNYINHNDAYNIAKSLTDSGNIYGLNSNNADSHLMKNSEWGAVTYLSQSKYGQNGTEITINNASLNSGNSSTTKANGNNVASVYAVTGCTSNTTNTTNTGENKTTIGAINGVTKNTATSEGIYTWNQKTGQNASTTGTIYGIYDFSGGLWERTADFISNGNTNLLIFGKALLDETNVIYTINGDTKTITANTGTSTKYVSIYPNNESGESNTDTASQKNFANNKKIYGDAVRETTSSTAGTSNTGWNKSSWNSGYSCFPGLGDPFFRRGGGFWHSSDGGAFAFRRNDGNSNFGDGFRAVLVENV